MKKLLTLIAILIASIYVANAQTNWVTHKGDERISVKFPAEPKELIPGSFIVKGPDSIVYVFTIIDFVKVAGVDSTTIAPVKDTPEFAAELLTGMKTKLPQVTFDDVKLGKWKGFSTYTSSGVDAKNKKYNLYMFIIGNKLYSMSTIKAVSNPGKGSADFFNSVELTN